MIASLVRRLWGSARIALELRGQRRVPFLPPAEVAARRDRRVRAMVAHAARHVPFYREWFAANGVDPRDVRGARDLERLPLLDGAEVRADPDRFLADTRAARRGIAFVTSGTSGTPLRLRHDRRSLLANIAYGERERDPLIRLCGGGFRPRELYVGYETSTFKKVMAFTAENAWMPVAPRRRFVSLLEPIEAIAALVTRDRPDILVGYGGWIDLFFRTVAARGLELQPPKLVLFMGEALPPGARAAIEERWGSVVVSRYNAVEAFKIGFFCERRTGFHLHEDLCAVRIVGGDGESLPDGSSGRIVLSNLVNRASVLLNYPIGDLGTISPTPCACGRSFRVLEDLDGRIEDVLPLADGRSLHPRAIWQVFQPERALLQYQLVQHSLDRYELRLATIDEAAFRAVSERALPALRALLGAGAAIETSRQVEIERPPNGKLRMVRSLRQGLSA